ncbi:MAG: zinc ribbon domain-containing protein [Myxococcaceae bacterium]
MVEREIAHCPQCGHLIYESHRRPGAQLTPCPGCGTEIDLGQPAPRLAVVPAAPKSVAPEEVAPTGFRLVKKDGAVEISFGEPRSMRPLGVTAWVLVAAATIVLSVARHNGMSAWWPPLIAAITLVVLIARSPLVAIRTSNGLLSVTRQRRTQQFPAVKRLVAEGAGGGAQLLAEAGDGARTVVLDELPKLQDAQWLAERLNREL